MKAFEYPKIEVEKIQLSDIISTSSIESCEDDCMMDGFTCNYKV